MTYVDISGLDPAAVLAALYNASQQQGLGFLNPRGQQPMTVEDAAAALAVTPHRYFDYLHGRVMKVELTGVQIDVRLYDRDNGEGAGAAAIARLRHIAA